jgi:signal transduction histidine kinase
MAVSKANNRVFSEQVAQLYHAARLGMIGSLLNATFLVAVLRLQIPRLSLFIWFACLFGVSLLRSLLHWQYHRTDVNAADCGRWRTFFLAGLFASGAVWGSVPLFFYPESSPAHQVFIAFLVGGMVAGAAGALSFVHGAFLAFCLPALGPLVAQFILSGDEIHLLMGIILLLYCTLLFFSSRKTVEMIRKVFSLKLENSDLITSLETINAELKEENSQRKMSQADLQRHRERLEEMVDDRTGELREANHKLQESSRAKSEFIAIASHELRTPLSSILGYSEILTGSEPFKEEERREFLQIIQAKAEALETIVDDLLDLSSGESGHSILLHKTREDICQLIRHEVALFQRGSPRHQFQTTIAEELVEFQFDGKKIERILENLFSNAVKYSPHGGTIVINTRKQGAYYFFSVSDDGIGMTPDQVDKVFDKFYRADSSNTAVSGLGLGMSIVKQIVEVHGGRIWVQSEPNCGTTVSFTLLLEEA